MNKQQENFTSMCYKVQAFFAEHLDPLTSIIPIIENKVDLLNNKLQDLTEFEAKATADITGYAAQKHHMREEITSLIMAVSTGCRAFHLDAGNEPGANRGTFTRSQLGDYRDSEFFIHCRDLVAFCLPDAAAMAAYNVTLVKLNTLTNLLGNFEQRILVPDHQRADEVGYGKEVDRHIVALKDMLHIIDGLMGTVQVSNELLYDIYKADRLIDDDTSGSGTPPYTVFTIAPGTFHVAVTIPYLPGRNFKVKNLDADNIAWGLSTSNIAFSNPPQVLSGNSVSNYESNTLGPDGDILLFQNPSANAVEIEVTIIE